MVDRTYYYHIKIESDERYFVKAMFVTFYLNKLLSYLRCDPFIVKLVAITFWFKITL